MRTAKTQRTKIQRKTTTKKPTKLRQKPNKPENHQGKDFPKWVSSSSKLRRRKTQSWSWAEEDHHPNHYTTVASPSNSTPDTPLPSCPEGQHSGQALAPLANQVHGQGMAQALRDEVPLASMGKRHAWELQELPQQLPGINATHGSCGGEGSREK